MSIDTYFDVVVVYFTVHSKILKDKLKIRSMSEKKKRKRYTLSTRRSTVRVLFVDG